MSLPRSLRHRTVSQLHVIRKIGFRLWQFLNRARPVGASSASDPKLVDSFNKRCDQAFHQLTPQSDPLPFTSDVPTVICLARNEEYRINAFIEHYLKLGAKSIHIIDNESQDRTAEFARQWPYVTVWHAKGSYREAEHGNLWRGALSRRYGQRKWILNLDADEFMVYSGMEQMGLPQLQAWLSTTGKLSLCLPIIDMYPHHISCGSKRAAATSFDTLIEESPYFDRPQSELTSTCWIQSGHRGIELKGGIRLRMMHDLCVSESPWVNVFPLARWSEHTSYCNGSRHSVFPEQINTELFFAALLHFKFVGNFAAKINEATRTNQYWNNSIEYRRYDRWMRYYGDKSLTDDTYSVRYAGPTSLIEAGLIQPIRWTCRLGQIPVNDEQQYAALTR